MVDVPSIHWMEIKTLGSMYANIPQMLAYIPDMDPMGKGWTSRWHMKKREEHGSAPNFVWGFNGMFPREYLRADLDQKVSCFWAFFPELFRAAIWNDTSSWFTNLKATANCSEFRYRETWWWNGDVVVRSILWDAWVASRWTLKETIPPNIISMDTHRLP